MKKILLTGANGFISRNLREKLDKEKYDLTGIDIEELNLLSEAEVFDFLQKGNFNIIIHTANQPSARNAKAEDLSIVIERNLRMFFNIERCKDYYDKMLFFGSGAEYDMQNYSPNMSEDYFDKFVPKDQYGFSKYIMSKIASREPKIYDMRIFGIFGPYEDWKIRFISNACCKAIFDLPITITQNVFFDYMYVNDFVKIMEWFIDNTPKEKCYNITTGKSIDLITLAKKVVSISGKNLEIIVANEGLKPEYSGNNNKLLNEMGGFQFTDIDKAIKELYQWYLDRKDTIDKNKLFFDK